ncbi:MAG: hypothetical protein M0P64_04385 [Candidatus Pacebacteria bacterium]|jgi:hypothetical protein|nr:hypothetical protein [Candidatus Paceibacterota bacterium]
MTQTGRFSAIAVGVSEPRSAHPGYEDKEAQVDVADKNQTLHFFKEDGGFHVTLYHHPSEDGRAPAISLGFIGDEAIAVAIREGVLSIEGRRFELSNTRALRRIL